MGNSALDPAVIRTQEDCKFWRDEIMPPILSLMKSAGYSVEDQERYADFINHFVIPSLGPRPSTANSGARLPHFDSFCTDDFSPVELSWNVGPTSSRIRIGSEPIGRHAGTAKDPFNQAEPEAAMARLLRRHAGCGAIDGELWEFFRKRLHVEARDAKGIVSRMATDEHMTSNHICFDLEGEYPVPKVYFYPIAFSLLQENYGGEGVADIIGQLPLNLAPSFNHVREFVRRDGKECDAVEALRVEIIAFDAVRPTDARLKVYMRMKETCMARVSEVYTLGETLKGPVIEGGLELIRSFYMHVFGPMDPEEELARSTHRTAGIIFNMEIKHNQLRPVPKVYIPVRHYGGTDLLISRNLCNFFRSCGLASLADTYVDAVQRAFPSRDFGNTIGRHSYVALSYTEAGPYVTMYYNTMIFSAGDERDAAGKLIGPAASKQRHLLV